MLPAAYKHNKNLYSVYFLLKFIAYDKNVFCLLIIRKEEKKCYH